MIKENCKTLFFSFLYGCMGFLLLCNTADAQPFRADAVVERTSVFTGEPFLFQIQVSGSENPERPDLSKLAGFNIQFEGGRQNSSTSVTIINGKMTKSVRTGYIFSYQLTPQHAGSLIIPSITVRANGQKTRTGPLKIIVKRPEQTKDFKLKLGLSKNRCYVGEPVILTVTWYLGKDVRNFHVNLPLLGEKDLFYFEDLKINRVQGRQYYRIPLGDGEVIGEKGRGVYNGEDYATLTFKKVLIPKKAFRVQIKPGSVACEALMGYTRRRNAFGDDSFPDFFNDDFFNTGKKGIYRKIVVPSNSLELVALKLPEKGRPADFAGHIGHYSLKAQASPTMVSVGDPITLKVTVSGPDYLEHINLPPLKNQPLLKNNFKIPGERAVGEIKDGTKVFTQTIRPLKPGIKEIPPIKLSYFDTTAGKYKTAQTAPIPLHVKAARVVTAMDAEGRAGPPVAAGNDVETWSRGIAYNYDDIGALENQRIDPLLWLMSPGGLLVLCVPPALFFMFFTLIAFVRHKKADPVSALAKKAGRKLVKSLKNASHAGSESERYEAILDGFRNYFGDKLGMNPAAITFNDVKDRLAEKGIDHKTLNELKSIFSACEAGRYSGDFNHAEMANVYENSQKIAKKLEKKL